MYISTPQTEEDYDQIFKLNYKTFVEEIPQHQENKEKILVDKHHFKNKYLIAKRNQQIIGMICYSTERPFSLDYKVADLDKYLPHHESLAEIRLLTVIEEFRSGLVAFKLFKTLAHEMMNKGIDMAVISGSVSQLSLYQKIGFTAFGPVVGTVEAPFQPMYLTSNTIRSDFK